MELGRVFLSSAFRGMGDLRQAAADAARLLGLIPEATEELVAHSDTVRDRLRIQLGRCDTYVGLFDTWRGTVPPEGTEGDRAITEEEFRLASKLGLRRLAFVSKAADRDRDSLLKDFLEREVSHFTGGVWARPFDSPEQLRREIVAGLSLIRPRVVLGIEARGVEVVAALDLTGVRPAWSGAAQLGPQPVTLAPGPSLRAAIGRLREGKPLDEALLRAAGGELAAGLLPGEISAALEAILDRPGCRLLELGVRTALPEALALPWELLSFGRHPLPVQAGRMEVVRRRLAPGDDLLGRQDGAPTVPAEHLEILGFTAAPLEDSEQAVKLGADGGIQADSDLFWENEQEKLLLALDRLLGERRGRLILPESGEAEVLRQELAKELKARVVHISCHGGAEEEPGEQSGEPASGETAPGTGALAAGSAGSAGTGLVGRLEAKRRGRLRPVLLLEDEAGHRRPVGARELAAWSQAASEPPALLVLSACSTAGSIGGEGSGPGWRAGASAASALGAGVEEGVSLGAGRMPGALVSGSGVEQEESPAARAGPTWQALSSAVEEDESGAPGPSPAAQALDSGTKVGASPAVDARLGTISLGAPSSPREAPGLAEALVAAGLPRVLGMQGPVSDAGATAFAAAFYRELARGVDLPLALRAGRAALAAQGRPGEWALPVLLGGRDFGPLVAPEGTVPEVETPFDLALDAFEIEQATYLKTGYAGRRATERRLRNAFARGGSLIAIYGLGGIGKSTLATRFLSRRSLEGAQVETLFAGRPLAPEPFFEEVAERFGVRRQEGLAPEEQERALRTAMRSALRGTDPTVLYLDNFEDNQDRESGAVAEELGKVLLDLLALGGERFRLLLTTRTAPRFPGVALAPALVDLGELPPSSCRKMRLHDREGLGRLREEEWQAALFHLGGHPKALDLLGGYLREGEENARAILKSFGPVREELDARLRAEHQRHGRALFVDDLLARVPAERLAALERLCLLEVPLPTGELIELLEAGGVSSASADLAWLRGQGLLAEVAGKDLVHRLLADRKREALVAREGGEAAKGWHLRVAEHFETREGPLADFGVAAQHRDAAGDRAGALMRYEDWAKALRDRHAYAASMSVAKEGLERLPHRDVESEKVAAARLLTYVFYGLDLLGRKEEAALSLDQVWSLVAAGTEPASLLVRAGTKMLKGKRALELGDVARGTELFQDAMEGFAVGGDDESRAVLLGEIAKQLLLAGDVGPALALHEEQIQIFERLGDVRSRAIILREMARLKVRRGDVESALALYEKQTQLFERLGDARERAVTLGEIARLLSRRGEVEAALALHKEVLQVYERLGAVALRATTLGDIARLRAQSGDVESALALHGEQVEIFERLGDVRSRAVALGDIAHLRAESGAVESARQLQEERLEVHRSLGDLDGIAATLSDLAQLDLLESRWDAATERLVEAWKISLQIGRAEVIEQVGELLGQLLAGADREAALGVLRRSRAAYARLGWQPKVDRLDGLIAQVEALPTPESPADSGEPSGE